MPFSKDITTYPNLFWDIARLLVRDPEVRIGYTSRAAATNARHKFNAFRSTARTPQGKEIALGMLGGTAYEKLITGITTLRESIDSETGATRWLLVISTGTDGILLNRPLEPQLHGRPDLGPDAQVADPALGPADQVHDAGASAVQPKSSSKVDDLISEFFLDKRGDRKE